MARLARWHDKEVHGPGRSGRDHPGAVKNEAHAGQHVAGHARDRFAFPTAEISVLLGIADRPVVPDNAAFGGRFEAERSSCAG
jgi:hypothetical protein